jgi:hypothetical protein
VLPDAEKMQVTVALRSGLAAELGGAVFGLRPFVCRKRCDQIRISDLVSVVW